MKNIFLKNQLKDLGASKDESRQLADLANELNSLAPPLSNEAKNNISDQIGFKQVHNIPTLRIGLAGAVAVFAILIVLAQSALPGSVLYALKRGTEEVRVLVQPGFNKEDLKQRRDAEKIEVKKQVEIEDNSSQESKNESKNRQGSDDIDKNDSSKSDDSKSETSNESGRKSDSSNSDRRKSESSRDD